VQSPAFGPSAAKETWGWLLRLDAGRVRTCSANAPIPSDGVVAGSKPGMVATYAARSSTSSPAVAARNAREVNEFSEVSVGTTSVAPGPAAARSAPSSVAAPPSTGPTLRKEQ
jgi:hypothetical protein